MTAKNNQPANNSESNNQPEEVQTKKAQTPIEAFLASQQEVLKLLSADTTTAKRVTARSQPDTIQPYGAPDRIALLDEKGWPAVMVSAGYWHRFGVYVPGKKARRLGVKGAEPRRLEGKLKPLALVISLQTLLRKSGELHLDMIYQLSEIGYATDKENRGDYAPAAIIGKVASLENVSLRVDRFGRIVPARDEATVVRGVKQPPLVWIPNEDDEAVNVEGEDDDMDPKEMLV